MSIKRRISLVSETVGTSPRVRAALLGVVGPTPGREKKQLMTVRVWSEPPTVVRPAIFRQHFHISTVGVRRSEMAGETRRHQSSEKSQKPVIAAALGINSSYCNWQ